MKPHSIKVSKIFHYMIGRSSATLPICCVICTGYLFSTVYSLN